MTPKTRFALAYLLVFIALVALLALGSWILGISALKAWPAALGAAGLVGLAAGIRRKTKPAVDFVVPSLVFVAMSAFFALFAFDLVEMRFRDFILAAWPYILALSAVTAALLVRGAARRKTRR